MDNIDWNQFFLSAEGRLNRQPWWLAVMLFVTVEFVVGGLFGEGFIALLLFFFMLYSLICICAKRCHDRGKSGWWCILLFVPIVGFFWAVIDLGILEGDQGPNEYGPDPLAA